MRRDELEAFSRSGQFAGSCDDRRDGFIHLSTPAQVAGTLAKHFSAGDGAGEDDLTLLSFDPAMLGGRLKWETSRNGEAFPHFYGRLEWDWIVSSRPISRDAAGGHVLPDDLV